MVLVYFRGHGNWYMADETGISKQENKVEHRELSAENPRMSGSQFYLPGDSVEGVFRLSDTDDLQHQITGLLDKEKISRLLPCQHPHSAFDKLVKKSRLPAEIVGQCYFEIRRNKYSEFILSRRPYLRESAKLDYSLEFIKQSDQFVSNKSETKLISGFSIASTPNSGNDHRPTRNTDYQEIITAALNGMASNYDDPPQPVALLGYIWSESFRHSCIVEKTAKELILVSGKKVGRAEIRKAYQRTTLKKPNKSSNKVQ